MKGFEDLGKKIWIINHYAINHYYNKAGRHFWFSENLIKNGYDSTVFCSNIRHNSDENIEIKNEKYILKYAEMVPFVFVKTSHYKNNGLSRINNMLTFYKNLFPAAREYAKHNGKPDVIIASSVHPLTMVAGIKIAKEFGIPCIAEVRDLWPESIVAYGNLKRTSSIAKILYRGEKWIYKRADSIIMTWEGGKEYIEDQGWSKDISLSKVHHINNGVVINQFDKNSKINQINDLDLTDSNYKNVVYAGSIRKVNNLGILLDSAKLIQAEGINDIRFLIYGSGNESEMLIKRCADENIRNVIFKGRVEKKFIPSILTKSHVNILHNSSTSLDKYGQSQNKFFEYLAAGKCIVQTYTTGYSVIKRANCGISVPIQTAQEISKAVIKACADDKVNKLMGENARKVAFEFDFENLTRKLINTIEEVEKGEV